MREKAAAGILFVIGLILFWSGFSGTTGAVLAAQIAPAELIVDAPANNGAGSSGGF